MISQINHAREHSTQSQSGIIPNFVHLSAQNPIDV